MPITGGAWCLPSLHPDVPCSFNLGKAVNDTLVADLVLEAHTQGLQIPSGRFMSIEKTLEQQWKAHVATALGGDSPLGLDLILEINSQGLSASIGAVSRISCLRLKPLIDRLNQAQAGLGWWVYDVAHRSTSDALPIYGIDDYANMFCIYNGFDDFSDESVVEYYNDNSEESEIAGVAELKESGYISLWPSDVVEAMGGYSWMCTPRTYNHETKGWDTNPKPQMATLAEVTHFMQNGAAPDIQTIVKDFIVLHEKLESIGDSRWDQANEDGFPLGATCILVWDSSDVPLQIIDEYEQYLLNCGDSSEVHVTLNLRDSSHDAISGFCETLKTYVAMFAAVGKAFSHFEVV